MLTAALSDFKAVRVCQMNGKIITSAPAANRT
jgi:hypothetical protein